MNIGNTRSGLNRKPAQRKPMLRNLVTSLILYESLRTTRARAKAIQPIFDRMVTKVGSCSTHIAIRFINKIVTDKNASRKMLEVFRERFKRRQSGFTRIKPIGRRIGDGAEMVEISLVDADKPVDTPHGG